MTDKEKLVQMLLRCSMSTGHADTMDDLIAEAESQIMELRQKNADLVEALHTISFVKANVVNPNYNYMWDNHTEKDCYETGLLDGAMAVRDAVKTEAYSVIAKAIGGK